MEDEWLIIKIFPVYKEDWSDAFFNVINCRKKYLNDLEKLADGKDTFFLHYADRSMRERPHFKFFIENPSNFQEFVNWVKKHIKKVGIIDIGIFFGFKDKTLEEGRKARKVVELLNKKNIANSLKNLKTELEKTDYADLEPGIGKHYVHNMLGLDSNSERILVS